jgi:hypothetical protein
MKKAMALCGLVVALAVPAAAFADSCANVSRAPAACGTNCPTPVVEGNWVWLPSLDALMGGASLPPIWGFVTPGTGDALLLQTPDANGNYTNGQTESLQGLSAICTGKGNVQIVRQSSHGIQSGCE